MFKRSIIIFLLTVFSLFLLSGCYPTGMIRAESNKSGDEKTVFEIADEIDNLTLSLTLPDDALPEMLPKLRVSHQKWDKDKLCEIFLGDKTIIEQTECDIDYKNEKQYSFEADDSILFFEPGDITYFDESKDEYGYDYLQLNFNDLLLDERYTYAKECNFPLSDAVDTVTGILDKIGIRNYTLSEVWAVTADIANDLLSDEKRMIKHEDGLEFVPYSQWSNDDEAYLLRYSIVYENIPVMTRSACFVGNYMTQGSVISAVVIKDKIISFTCDNIFGMKYEITEPTSVKVSAETALKDIMQNFSRRQLRSPNEVFDVKLVYANFECVDDPTGRTYILMPMWQFDYSEDNQLFKGLSRSRIFVDIQTGNRFDRG